MSDTATTIFGIDPTIDGDDLSDTRLPEAVFKGGAGKTPTATAELLRSDATTVRAESVAMERAGADQVTADRVSVTNSGIRSVEAKSAQIDQSGVLLLRGGSAVLQGSSVVSVVADEARLVNSPVLFLKAGSVTIDDAARVLVVDGGGGEFRPVLGTQGAAAFGAAFALALFALGRLFGRGRR